MLRALCRFCMHGTFPSEQASQRATIAALLFTLCCLMSSGRLLWDAPRPGHLKDPADVAKGSDQRFAALKAALPSRGVVGYIGQSGALARGDYYLAEYALAPLVVDDSTKHRIVVGNFPSTAPAHDWAENLQLVNDYGDGVLLFANKDAR
jgi:hypothetical protein